MLVGCALLAGCHRAPMTYRLTTTAPHAILVPPGARNAEQTDRKIQFRSAASKATCRLEESGIAIQGRKGRIRVRVSNAGLASAPPGWLLAWARRVQEEGCLAPGEVLPFALELASSVPLRLGLAHRLLHPNLAASGYTEVHPGYRIRVTSPIYREGAAANASPFLEAAAPQAGPGGSIALDLRSPEDFLGYEIAWYDVKPAQGGAVLEPAGAETRVDGVNTQSRESKFQHLGPHGEPAHFRVLFLTRKSASDHDALVVAGVTESELHASTVRLARQPELCTSPEFHSRCFVIPRRVAALPLATVVLNGKRIDVVPGSSLRELLTQNTPEKPESLVERMRVFKPYRSGLAPVIFPENSPAILALPLSGGETIEW